jgi:predicted DNA-binding antitoxin AbrB/MazE fold protein
MAQNLKAVDENAVFRPLEPVRLREHQEVTLVLDTAEDEISAAIEKPIWQVAEDLVRDIPRDVLDSIPTDSAAQHDHYRYAAPKRG